MKRRRFVQTVAVVAAAPMIVRANAQTPLVARRAPVYGVDNPPHFSPGQTHAERAVWAAAVAEFLAAMGLAVGLEPARQRVTNVVDAGGMLNLVRLEHPLLKMALWVHDRGKKVALHYGPGPESPLWATRHPYEVTYSAVYHDATSPTARSLIPRCRWLAGLGQ